MLAGRADGVIAAHRRGEVLGDRDRGKATRFAAVHAPADTVGHQHDRRETLTAERHVLDIGEAGRSHDHLRVHRAEQEVILIAGAHVPLMRNPEKIEFIIFRTRETGDLG